MEEVDYDSCHNLNTQLKSLDMPATDYSSSSKLGFKKVKVLVTIFYIVLLTRIGLVVTASTLEFIILIISSLLTLHGMLTLAWMFYAWDNPDKAYKNRSPSKFKLPLITFTALVPARNEEQVIAQTIRAISNMNYPQEMCETIILCREDDVGTINAVNQVMYLLNVSNIRLKTFNDFPINKPHALNIGLKEANHDVVAVFDAEDEPHADIYNIVNTVMVDERVEVVQSGVQLMNYKTRWFTLHNCMEYYFWFKSGLLFFSNVGKVSPLGGNTVFFIKSFLYSINGWDEKCLTEDADIGITLVSAGAKVKVIYDEEHVTMEEAPISLQSYIKQRTRWNQGFLQILAKGTWKKLKTPNQQLTTLYVLLTPLFQMLIFFYIPIGIYIALTTKMSIVLSLFSFVPLFLLILQLSTVIIGSYSFTKAYSLKYNWYLPIVLILTYLPYQLLLLLSALRAVFRFILRNNLWEKTAHVNAHRKTF